MKNIYDRRRLWKLLFVAASCIIASVSLYFSNNLVKDLAAQERERMEIWANATKQIATAGIDGSTTDIDFLLNIIEANRNIPVLLVDDLNNIILHRNFKLPEPVDNLAPYEITPANQAFLQSKLQDLQNSSNKIEINIDKNTTQYLFYEDSILLKRLHYYPYIQILVMLIFIAVVYFAVISMQKAEQNKVWVGLSKETAHQLGTPISSLMAWVQMLDSYGIDKEIITDMDKDVHRLSVIADRFSKIGSNPELELRYINESVNESLSYMRSRISNRVKLAINTPEDEVPVKLCFPLFEWVMENLTKNAVDAMQGEGSLTFEVFSDNEKVYIDVTDSGKGISRKNFKNVFNPGYTTKNRGWGLGLTLVKRIIEDYHNGRIYVKDSELNVGTTFRIELPLFNLN